MVGGGAALVTGIACGSVARSTVARLGSGQAFTLREIDALKARARASTQRRSPSTSQAAWHWPAASRGPSPTGCAAHPPTEFPGLSSLREILGSKKPQLFDGIAIRTACSAATFS